MKKLTFASKEIRFSINEDEIKDWKDVNDLFEKCFYWWWENQANSEEKAKYDGEAGQPAIYTKDGMVEQAVEQFDEAYWQGGFKNQTKFTSKDLLDFFLSIVM